MFNSIEFLNFVTTRSAQLKDEANRFLESSTVTFSQNGEDIIIRTLLAPHQQNKGIFIDIGAYHPYRFSNTFAIYLAGWRGVNVDANLDAISEFNRVRPDDINIHSGIAAKEMTLHLTRFEEGAYNTLNLTPEQLKTYEIRSPVKDVTELKCQGINDFLEKHVSGKKFDLLTFDIEGLDKSVFEAIDFSRFRPLVLACEIDHPTWSSYTFIRRLGEIGYEIYCQCGGTTILVRSREQL